MDGAAGCGLGVAGVAHFFPSIPPIQVTSYPQIPSLQIYPMPPASLGKPAPAVLFSKPSASRVTPAPNQIEQTRPSPARFRSRASRAYLFCRKRGHLRRRRGALHRRRADRREPAQEARLRQRSCAFVFGATIYGNRG
jgi:hypothetical protein